ncbi:hypothetical protein FB45DRAFT_1130102 [Roridomyces roridus]|uniref:F-box domain-containing protein n=1 Tax=Roridomyces roridus TaxID=1738132 RepID=A0AAD7B2U9_9AGAR|nr:hypothetical protein FB45DRAFT_1130102 [Roridomyces roridus]
MSLQEHFWDERVYRGHRDCICGWAILLQHTAVQREDGVISVDQAEIEMSVAFHVFQVFLMALASLSRVGRQLVESKRQASDQSIKSSSSAHLMSHTRSQLGITLWLPNEVLTEIIQHAQKSDQAALCRISKLFHALVLPVLNRVIVLSPYRRSASYQSNFCQSLIEHPDRTDVVRSLTIRFRVNDWFGHGQDWVAQIDQDLLFESMKLMKNLEYLSLGSPRDSSAEPEVASVFARLACLSFPKLSHCSIIMPHEMPAITQFLAGNPSITRLNLPVEPWHAFEPGRNLLPNLRQYVGPTSLLRSLATRGLRAARVVPERELTAGNVQAVEALTNPDLPFVLSVELARAWVSEDAIQTSLLLVSAEMPYIQRLQVRASRKSRFATATFNRITTHLSHFTQIAYFSLTYINYRAGFFDAGEREEAAMRTWAAACPTLQGCCIERFAWRKVGEQWERCTTQAFDIQAGFSVFDP